MVCHMQDQYNIDNPEPWYIRRGAHKGALLAEPAAVYQLQMSHLVQLCFRRSFAVSMGLHKMLI